MEIPLEDFSNGPAVEASESKGLASAPLRCAACWESDEGEVVKVCDCSAFHRSCLAEWIAMNPAVDRCKSCRTKYEHELPTSFIRTSRVKSTFKKIYNHRYFVMFKWPFLAIFITATLNAVIIYLVFRSTCST